MVRTENMWKFPKESDMQKLCLKLKKKKTNQLSIFRLHFDNISLIGHFIMPLLLSIS